MKKNISILLFVPFLMFAQNDGNSNEFSTEEIFAKRVYINKTVTSYNFSTVDYENDTKINSKDYINFKNPVPTKIIISTDENNASIRISSKYYKEDLIFKYKRVYKFMNDDGSFYYQFSGKTSCDAFYAVPEDNGNQFLFIKCLDSNKNGNGLTFTMSRNEQI